MISKAFKWFLIVYLIFLAVGAVVLYHIEKGDWVIYLNQSRFPLMDTFFKYWTHLGDGLFVLVLIIILLFIKYRFAIVFMFVAAAQGILSGIFKRLIFSSSMRPKKFFEGIYELQFIEGVQVHSNYSFPSGHTMTAFSIAAYLSLITPKRYLGVVFFFYALLVAFSRNYLSQHFFEDIFAGSIVGVATTFLIWRSFRVKERRKWMDGSLREKF
ncbi:MAG: phosphatase PAP2 family protein [Cyclobacteriaceae bacterium]